jgi:hypothetical protein
MKPKSNVWMYEVVLSCVLVMVVVLSLGCLQKESEEVVPPTPTIDKEEIVIVPEEFALYQDYIKIIGGEPGISDIGTIEATVLSITKTEVCPDKTDPFAPEPTECSIEPYPKDLGIVRVDKIINYTLYSEQIVEPTIEQPSDGGSSEEQDGDRTPGYEGPEYPSKPEPSEGKEYVPLHEGQEVQTLFLLTVRPAKVRYAKIIEPKGGMESAQESGNTNSEQDIISHVVTPGKEIFKPIPKDGDYYVFTTKYGLPEAMEKNLPGLEVGSKFRAEIYYDGSIYVEEYQVIK